MGAENSLKDQLPLEQAFLSSSVFIQISKSVRIHTLSTVCPGSSDRPEKNNWYICIIKWGLQHFINYYDTSGWILFVYGAK